MNRRAPTAPWVNAPRPSGAPVRRIVGPVREGPPGTPESRIGPRRLVRWLFVLFVASIPFENFAVGEGSLAKLFGYLFLLIAVVQPGVCFRRPPRAFWWFLAYIIVFFVRGTFLFGDEEIRRRILSEFVQLVRLLILFWMSHSLLSYERMVPIVLRAFVCACIGLSLLQMTGVTRVDVQGEDTRVTAFGADANIFGATLALGAVTLIGLSYGRERSRGMTHSSSGRSSR